MRRSISTLLLALFCFASNDALAHTVQAHEVHAVIESIDFQKSTLALTYLQERGPQKLIWKTATQFLRDRKLVPATELNEGTKVRVYYHSPFFGKPFVTKIVWESRN